MIIHRLNRAISLSLPSNLFSRQNNSDSVCSFEFPFYLQRHGLLHCKCFLFLHFLCVHSSVCPLKPHVFSDSLRKGTLSISLLGIRDVCLSREGRYLLVEKLCAKASGIEEQAYTVKKSPGCPSWNEEWTLSRWHNERLLHMYLKGLLLIQQMFVVWANTHSPQNFRCYYRRR